MDAANELDMLIAEAKRDGLCSLFCGNDRLLGDPNGYCENCAEWIARENAREEARERREKAKEQAAQRRAELAAQGCGCPSEAECRLWDFDWTSMSKTRAEKTYRELKVSCVRSQRRQAEWKLEQAEKTKQQNEITQQKRQAYNQYLVDLRAATLIDPVVSLASMRGTVLAERHDRCPKWRFKLEPELVVQIQPRPAERRDRRFLFKCLVLVGAGITREHFYSAAARRAVQVKSAEFGIKDEDGRWRLDLTSVAGLSFKAEADRYAARIALMQRVAAQLPLLAQLSASKMFTHSCLCCGKMLTDPASMARWVGPECAGTSSLDAGMFGLK
jgi:Family of unknown function (DUF6011)